MKIIYTILFAVFTAGCAGDDEDNQLTEEQQLPRMHIKHVPDWVKDGLTGRVKTVTRYRYPALKAGENWIADTTQKPEIDERRYDTAGFHQSYRMNDQLHYENKYTDGVLVELAYHLPYESIEEKSGERIQWEDSFSYTQTGYSTFKHYDTTIITRKEAYVYGPNYRLIKWASYALENTDSPKYTKTYTYAKDNMSDTSFTSGGEVKTIFLTLEKDNKGNPTKRLFFYAPDDYSVYHITYEYYQ